MRDADNTSESDFVFITVNAAPFPPLAVSISATPGTTVDERDSVPLLANPSGGDTNYAFAWSTGESTASITVTPPIGATNYSVTLSGAAATPSATDTITITITANPAPPAGLVACFTFDNTPALGVTTTFDSTSSSTGLTCTSWHVEFQAAPGPTSWFTEAAFDGCGTVFGGTPAGVLPIFTHSWTESPQPVPHRVTLTVDDGTGANATTTQNFGTF